MEVVALNSASDGVSATTAWPAAATALRAACADANARASDADVAVVVAVEAFLGAAFGGVGEHDTVAYGDGSCRACIRVDGIVAVAETHGHAAVEEDSALRVDAVVVAFEVMLTAFNVDLGLRFKTFGAAFGGCHRGGTAVEGRHATHFDGFCRAACR